MATYLDLMFRDTIAGSMLRTLMLKGEMTQREFMRVYHERCGRADAPAKSAFGANFGRFIAREQVWNRGAYPSISPSWQTYDSPLGCLTWHRPITGRDSDERMNRLEWGRPTFDRLLLAMDDPQIDAIEQSLERMVDPLKPRRMGVADDDTVMMLQTVRSLMRGRAEGVIPSFEQVTIIARTEIELLYGQVVYALNRRVVPFADWYWDGAELSTMAKLRGDARKAWVKLRAHAEAADHTVGEYLEAFGISWARETVGAA